VVQRIILPGEVGAELVPRLTVAGITEMIRDWRKAGVRIPNLILVSEYDRRDLNQDLMAGAQNIVGKEDHRPEHDGEALGCIEGVWVSSSPHVPRGKCRFVYPPEKAEVSERIGGEGLIIVGA
jgi:hypothetical protein